MNSFYVFSYILSIIIASFSQILLKKGSERKNIYFNFYTIIGYGLMFLSAIMTLISYKGIDLSYGQVLQSMSFLFVILFSKIFLNEKISKNHLIGMITIIIGILIFNI